MWYDHGSYILEYRLNLRCSEFVSIDFAATTQDNVNNIATYPSCYYPSTNFVEPTNTSCLLPAFLMWLASTVSQFHLILSQ